jgi:hypothetical protein
LSFFDDEHDDELPPTTVRPAQTQPRPRRPQPRRPQRTGGAGGAGGISSGEHHAMMVRRRVAAVVGVLLLVVIVLVVNGCLKRGKQQALESYNQDVARIAQQTDQQVSHPLFGTLTGAGSRSAQEVDQQVNGYRQQAQELAEQAKALKVPGEMVAAQRALLLAMDLRVEGLTKLAALIPTALGGQAQEASSKIAGDMEIFLASDVLWSQRVAPLIQQELASGGVHGQNTAASRFLPNIGWLEQKTALARITGKGSSSSGPVAPGTHGHTLTGVSVGTNKLAPSPTLNHINAGSNPTFSVTLVNAGSNPETDVKVDISVTSEGKTLSTSHLINKTEPEKTVNVDIPVNGVTLGAASRITVNVEPVPGETETENNKATYLAIFGQ